MQRRRGLRWMLGLAAAAWAIASCAPASASPGFTAYSNGFVCSSQYGWVRVNWPTILPETSQLTPVYFRAALYQYRTSGRWKRIRHRTRWYVGVSDSQRRYQLDSSLGTLPYPFVGELGHLFAYESDGGSYAGPQLGPYWKHLPSASYRVREHYWVEGSKAVNRHAGVSCDV